MRGSTMRGSNIISSDTIINIVPDAISSQIPGLHHRPSISNLTETYFCNICFTNYPISEGFKLRKCSHRFCAECIKQYIINKINHGVIKIHCFHPKQHDESPCSQLIDEGDIHQIIPTESWQKYLRFKANTNRLSRQCPYCNHTQIGNAENPIMKCKNEKCAKLYCLYHSNAHAANMNCEEYELSIAKETRMNEMAIKAMGDDVKSCPHCKFRIFKNGGCNHMHCVKCGTSFCWLCLEIIEDTTIPAHFREGRCAGQQFDGMEVPPRWLIVLVGITMCTFLIPSVLLGVIFGLLCFPMFGCCDIRDEDGQKIALREILIGCMFGWMIIFAMLIVLLPIFLLRMLWNLTKCVYGLMRVCCPCLPNCPQNAENGDGNDPNMDNMLAVVSESMDNSPEDAIVVNIEEDEEKKENIDDDET